MTLLYQPISRTFGQRDGCLTPVNISDDKLSGRTGLNQKNKSDIFNSSSSLSSTHEILSPPLSPYQKESSSHDADFPAAYHAEHYLPSEHPFKIKNYRSYSMTVNPWSNLDANYKQRQLDFLGQYSFEAPRMVYSYSVRSPERRERRKREAQPSSSDSDSENLDRVRTRKVVKESKASSEIDSPEDKSGSAPLSPPQKKRKVRKEPSYIGSPLAAQQDALIDESLPDYSPDANSTLPKGNTRALKIEWKGQPMDLRSDPNLEKLHPAEVVLASTLRLRCNVYLDSKRRFFHEKVNRLRNGMPFRRTDAQKACRIDVNKASRLFAAFEKAGWLDDKHFKKFL